MIQIKQNEQKKSKLLYESYQKDYLQYLKSLLPAQFLEDQNKVNFTSSGFNYTDFNSLQFFNSKTKKSTRSNPSLNKSRITNLQIRKNNLSLGEFLLKLVKTIAKQKYVDQNGELQNITKQLGIDIKQLNKIEDSQGKIQFMLSSIDKHIEDQKKKLFYNTKNQANPSNSTIGQKPCSFAVSINNLSAKQNNFFSNNEYTQKFPSKYESFIKEQNKKQVDNFAWLQIKTKYPMLEKKLKSKLIQSINQDKNQKRIRQLIEKKQQSKKQLTNNSTISSSSTAKYSYIPSNSVGFKDASSLNRQSSFVDIQDQKIDLINESLFMEEFQKAKIDYVWTQNDQKMFLKNIKQLRKKCSNNSEFLKLCGRFKFISQKQFQTLASEQISRMLNRNNKIYLSREFLLDKYFSTTEVLTEQQMRFILKTSPMLSKCVDRNFIKTAIKNIRYENISDLELKIAEDIIGRFEKLRNSVRASRKAYKQEINHVAKQRIAFFEKNKQLQIAKQIAHQELKNHKTHLMRALNYEKKYPEMNKTSMGLSKKKTKNIWTPLNKYHPSTGLFVKDCNEQCTDDIFNPYEKEYLKKIDQTKQAPKRNIITKAEMIKFYTGGPDQNIATTFNATQKDVENICAIVKAFFFQKKILTALQSIEITSTDTQSMKRQDTRTIPTELKTKKTLGLSPEQEFEMMAKKKLMQNRQKAKQTVYVNKLLSLAAQNAYQSLKALNPQFTPEQVNTKDKKGNTALFYATKFNNEDFVQFLMKFGANPNTRCDKDFSPLHNAFRSNNLSIILKLLTSLTFPANLNVINSELKTPLAYCSRQVLTKLNLEDGVASVDQNTPLSSFDNNSLLQRQQFDKIKEEALEMEGSFARKVSQNRAIRKLNSTLTSIQNMNAQ